MNWTKLSFGKHAGKTLPQILFADPNWFFWAIENRVFAKKPELKREAKILYARARGIKIPAAKAGATAVEYVIHPGTGKFSHFEIVPADRVRHVGASLTLRRDVIDMMVPHCFASYDKLGYKNFIASLKLYVFGKESARITKARADEFFANKMNFV